MKKVKPDVLKNKIIENFIKVIESKPEIKNDEFIKGAYIQLKKSVGRKNG